MKFRFELGASVQLACSLEEGQVIGRAEYLNSGEPQYQVRYRAADGRQVEAWWGDSALV